MYRESGGRRLTGFYAAHMTASASERLALENRPGRRSERGDLLLHYQPQVDLASGAHHRCRGARPLASSRARGMVSPAKFIPLAEETGLILPIGEWVLRAACARPAPGKRTAGWPPGVAVNLSAPQFRGAGPGEPRPGHSGRRPGSIRAGSTSN